MAKSEGSAVRFATDDLNLLKNIVLDKRQPRSVKEAALGRIRQIERGLDKAVFGDYNSPDFKPQTTRPRTYSVSEMARQDEEGWA